MKARVFTCNAKDFPYLEVIDVIKQAKDYLNRGEFPPISGWTCSKIQAINVGDKAYFYRVGQEPYGFFARGEVVAEQEDFRLNLHHQNFSSFSDAYSFYDDEYLDYSREEIIESRLLAVAYQWDSVVDYDKPLLGTDLKAKPEFNHYKFLFRQSGQAFGDDFTKEHLELLDSKWESHVKKMAKSGFGAYLNF